MMLLPYVAMIHDDFPTDVLSKVTISVKLVAEWYNAVPNFDEYERLRQCLTSPGTACLLSTHAPTSERSHPTRPAESLRRAGNLLSRSSRQIVEYPSPTNATTSARFKYNCVMSSPVMRSCTALYLSIGPVNSQTVPPCLTRETTSGQRVLSIRRSNYRCATDAP